MSLLHISLTFFLLHLERLDLDLMSLSVLLLAGELPLDLSQIEQLSGVLESQRQPLLQQLSVLFQVTNVSVLESTSGLLILLLNLCESLVPSFVEVLILHEVRLLHLLAFAGLLVNKLLAAACEVLDFKFLNAVLGHLSFYVFAFHLALLAVLLQYSTI